MTSKQMGKSKKTDFLTLNANPHPACGHLLPSDGRRKLFLDVEPRAASAARTCPGLLSFALAGLRFEFALAPGRWRTATVAQPLPSSLQRPARRGLPALPVVLKIAGDEVTSLISKSVCR